LKINRHQIPKIEASIFADTNFVIDEYDLIIDISTLWRTGIFQADNDLQGLPNSIIIRSSHFTDTITEMKSIAQTKLTIEI